jgi:glutamate dehydrogenase
VRVLGRAGEVMHTTPAIREFLMRPEPLIITKANAKSRVHRRAYLDYVGIKTWRRGRLAGELRIVGLFTSTAYMSSVASIPYVRRKAAAVARHLGHHPQSHSGKALANILETYPRDELFQVDSETLTRFAGDILALGERPRVRVLVRPDKFDRYVSILVFVPRDRYDSDVRERIGSYLAAAFDGHVSAAYPSFPEGPLARVHFIIGRSNGETPSPPRSVLEAAVERITRTWSDGLIEALYATLPDDRAAFLAARYAPGFPAAYCDDVSPETALRDIQYLEKLTAGFSVSGAFVPAADDTPLSLRLFHLGGPVALSERVPMLENMGFRVIDERSYEIVPADERGPIWLHDMARAPADGQPADIGRLGGLLFSAVLATWFGHAENDGYNALVLHAGLGWRDVALLRAVSRYLRQAGAAFSQSYMAETMNRHAGIARDLVECFHARFGPAHDEAKADARAKAVEAALENVRSLDEDRIIRRFLNIVAATVRTNFFQLERNGEPGETISLKLDPARVEGLPAPRPFREIFVHGPRVDGVHLRFGRVARGGIRWSDRPQDFRTEVLGLAKAQQVKNAVIVPVGAKGGFVAKKLPAGGGREAIAAEGLAAYRIFISSLLDITDNIEGESVVPPAGVVRAEGDDPYLVVAADKGTATFSDAANAISEAHHFWLGDAFASGGSAGYDHKEMGITARGAWEAVKRHFREMDVDIQTTPFTVAGVGDMSGDVFGNAMMLSPATRLVAAFDHRDIFIDPDPDPARTLAERRRLFALPRSTWQDFDRSLISEGGGVFSRQDKAIRLSREMRALLGLSGETATPPEVIQAILRAPVDLLFFGGIGTFVRGNGESDASVGDRANDAVRIPAGELRARVVGEGANLGMTQRARIDYGLAGGRCNSDAIDNSAGVNTSDVEVNIKIALGAAVRSGKLGLAKRDRLLAAMTDEIAALVLRNNYLQTLAISVSARRGAEEIGFAQRLMQDLESRGLLDRQVETLPDDAALQLRRASGEALTRAETGVLLAHAKLALSHDLAGSEVVADPLLAAELAAYFPKRMRSAYAAEIAGHRLRREIIATGIANAMVNHGGPTYLTRIGDRTGAGPADAARAFVTARDVFAVPGLNEAIDRLDGKVGGELQLRLYAAVQEQLIAGTIWFARNSAFAGGIAAVIDAHRPTVAAVAAALATVLPAPLAADVAARARGWQEGGVPAGLARRIAALPMLGAAPDIHLVTAATGMSPTGVASVHFAIAERLHIARIALAARSVPVIDHMEEVARDRALDALAAIHRGITAAVLASAGDDPLAAWMAANAAPVERVTAGIAAILGGGPPSLARITVAADLLAGLARG